MCSHDLHIGQYTQCPSLILFTDSPIPTKHAKMSANYSHFFFSLFVDVFEGAGSLDSCLWTTTQTEHLTVQDGDVKDRPSQVDNQLLVMWTYRGQEVGEHSVSAGLLFIDFYSNRTLCTGPCPHRRGEQMASHFHSSLINCETNFGLNVSENSLRHLMLCDRTWTPVKKKKKKRQ